MSVQLDLFGAPAVVFDGDRQLVQYSNPTLLLIHLACRGDWVGRSELAFLFRPDESESRALAYLRLQLHRARRIPWAVGLEIEAQRLRWRVATDVQAFREAVDRCDWQRATDVYRAPLLAGQDFGSPTTYADWAELERERLARAFRRALIGEIGRCEEAGARERAADLALDLIGLDDLDEEALRIGLRQLALAGRRGRALELFGRFAALLDEELDLVPTEGTRALVRRIEAGSFDASARTAVPIESGRAESGRSLPRQSTRFVGRTEELARLRRLLRTEECRLLTVLGLGGAGKTRLAVEAAREQLHAFADGVFVVSLAPLDEATQVWAQCLRQLGLDFDPGTSPRDRLEAYLRDRRLLLVLDNAEHLPALADTLPELLAACPGLTLLTTSRTALNVRGEWLFELGGLDLPEPGRRIDAGALADFGATRLFLDAVRRRVHDFEASEADARAIVEIGHRLGGLPLALELAAGWARVMPIERILAELERGIDLLHGDLVDLPERQRSIRALLDGTWAQLSDPQRRLLARLSVFRGGASLDALEAVADAPLGLLLGLANRSLVARSGPDRFDLHPLVAHYAAERLERSADEAEVHERHLDHFRELARRGAQGLRDAEQIAWRQRIAREYDNLLAALARAHQAAPAEAALLTCDLSVYWERSGDPREANALLERALASGAEMTPETDVTLRLKRLSMAWVLGDYDRVRALADATLERCRQLDDGRFEAECCNILGMTATNRREYAEARRWLERGLARANAAGADRVAGYLLLNLGRMAQTRDDLAAALDAYARAEALARERGDLSLEMSVLANRSGIDLQREHWRDAADRSAAAMELARQVGNPRFLAFAKGNLAYATWQLGERREGARLYREHLLLVQEQGAMYHFVYNLYELAFFWVELGHVPEGIALWGAAERLHADRNYHDFGYDDLRKQVVDAVDEATREVLLRRGAALSLPQVVAMLEHAPLDLDPDL